MDIRKRFSPRVGVLATPGGKCRVQQHFKDECDVNYVIRNFLRTGVLPVARGEGQYFDCTSAPDYQEACNRIAQVHAWFDALPSATRSLFNNDPSLCLEHLNSDHPDLDLLKKAGFILDSDKPTAPAATPESVPDIQQPHDKTGEPAT